MRDHVQAAGFGKVRDQLIGHPIAEEFLVGIIGKIAQRKDRERSDLTCVAGSQPDEKWPESLWVFNRQGKQIKNIRRDWDTAVARAGIVTQDGRKVTVHDLRRTAVRNMSAPGVPQKVRMAISGHKTDSMERRYNIVDAADLKLAGELMAWQMRPAGGRRPGSRKRSQRANEL